MSAGQAESPCAALPEAQGAQRVGSVPSSEHSVDGNCASPFASLRQNIRAVPSQGQLLMGTAVCKGVVEGAEVGRRVSHLL